MLNLFGAHVTTKDTTATIEPASELHSVKVNVPGDISSAAYFIAAGLMVPGSEILIKNVGINLPGTASFMYAGLWVQTLLY